MDVGAEGGGFLAESYESGDKVSAVARRHGLTPQQVSAGGAMRNDELSAAEALLPPRAA